jgi:HD-GYP domain-containing protein (c-di-GMP phosphodiesterase class II)
LGDVRSCSKRGRIVAPADVFDVLVSTRSYKEAFDYNKTYDNMQNGDGLVMPGHFDPRLIIYFSSIMMSS